MEILYVTHSADHTARLQKELTRRHRVKTLPGPLHKNIDKISTKNIEILTLFVDSLVTSTVLDAFPKLRHIATQSTGTDHIDLAACHERGITVSHVPGYGETSVSELALLLLLGIARNLVPALNRARQGILEPLPQIGFELSGKTLGLVGTGAIGAQTARLARGFGMEILLFDQKKNAKLARSLKAKYTDSLEELLPQVDVLSLHVPLLPSTRHMISYEEIALMQEGATIINTARGGVVYSPAVLEAIENGHLNGLGTDVLELEQLLTTKRSTDPETQAILAANRALMHHPKVLHTLHLGANTTEAKERIFATTITNIKAAIKKKPENLAL